MSMPLTLVFVFWWTWWIPSKVRQETQKLKFNYSHICHELMLTEVFYFSKVMLFVPNQWNIIVRWFKIWQWLSLNFNFSLAQRLIRYFTIKSASEHHYETLELSSATKVIFLNKMDKIWIFKPCTNRFAIQLILNNSSTTGIHVPVGSINLMHAKSEKS